MTPGDVFQGAGTLIAAMIGIVGLAYVLHRESRERYSERFDAALSEVMKSAANRALALTDYMGTPSSYITLSGGQSCSLPVPRSDEPGGPMDAELQAAADIAWMAARRTDRQGAEALAKTLFHLKRGLMSWQIGQLGQITGDIRKWRTREYDLKTFVAGLQKIEDAAIRSETAYEERKAAGQ